MFPFSAIDNSVSAFADDVFLGEAVCCLLKISFDYECDVVPQNICCYNFFHILVKLPIFTNRKNNNYVVEDTLLMDCLDNSSKTVPLVQQTKPSMCFVAPVLVGRLEH